MRKRWIIGIDEVGRGPLAGPITVAAVAAAANYKYQTCPTDGRVTNNKQTPNFKILKNIKNSKKLSPVRREEWNEKIRGKFAYAISSVGPNVIDRIGINRAAKIAVARCLQKIRGLPSHPMAIGGLAMTEKKCAIFLDGGLRAPNMYSHQKTIIKGDERHPLIAAASIVAKVHRDAYMKRSHKKFSIYGFDQHKGYGTAAHRRALKAHGLCPIHRRSFCGNINVW